MGDLINSSLIVAICIGSLSGVVIGVAIVFIIVYILTRYIF